MEFFKPSGEGLEGIVARLHSQDANDRVKAAAELGEIGTPKEANELLKVAYEDEASTVRQMAIQAYAEIMEEASIQELVKAASDHFDDYVRLYAISTLGNLEDESIGDHLVEFLNFEEIKLQAATLRALIHTNASDYASEVFTLLQQTKDTLVMRNCLEALTLWRYSNAEDYIKSLFENLDQYNSELQTFITFYLASYGNTKAKEFLESGSIDEFIRISYEGMHFRGRKGILALIDRLN